MSRGTEPQQKWKPTPGVAAVMVVLCAAQVVFGIMRPRDFAESAVTEDVVVGGVQVALATVAAIVYVVWSRRGEKPKRD